MQAEHIPVHLGAMPAAVAAVRDERPRRGRPWILNDPYRGGTHLPDITVITPVFARRRAARLRRQPRPSRRRRRADARLDARRQPTLDEEGVVIAPRPLDDAAIDELVAQMRQPAQRRADLRAQLAANRDRRDARLRRARRARSGAARCERRRRAVLDYAERRTRACIAALADGARAGARRARGARRRPRAAPRARPSTGDALALDFTGSAAAARRQPQLPARRDALGLLLRGARPDRPRHPAERRRLPADRR